MVKRKKVSLKIIVLGDSCVGKTSLMKQYVQKRFYDDCKATVGIDLLTKQIIVDDYIVTLQIWDTAGKECFRSIALSFSKEADACILVFDVTSVKTFENLNLWHKDFLEHTKPNQPETFPFVVLGNKIDLSNDSVSADDAKQWCESHNKIPYFEISAKKGININIAFGTIVENVLAQKEQAEFLLSSPEIQVDTSSHNRIKNIFSCLS